MKKVLVLIVAMVLFAGCGEAKNKKEESAKADASAAVAQGSMAMMEATGAAPNSMISAGMEDLRKGNIRDAIKSFDEAIKANPRDVQGYLILGQTYMHLKEYNRAIDTFTVATQLEPENGQVHYLLATNFGLAGNFQMARLQAQKCVEIFRKNKDEDNFKRSVALLQGLPPVGGLPQAKQ